MIRIVNCLVLLLVFTVINSCRSPKKTTTADLPEEGLLAPCYSIGSFSVLTGRLELTFGAQSFSLNGSIYIRPDSIFHFRGRLLIEVVRGAIYRDSFVVVNYLERVCYKGKNEYLQKITGFPVTPETLLMLLTADKCEKNAAPLNNSRQQFSVNYDDYRQYEQFNLPTVVNISASDGRNRIGIKANFQQILLNQPEQVNISIPSGYRIVVLE